MRPCRLAGPAARETTHGQAIFDLDGIADGEDVGIAGPRLIVNADAASRTNIMQACFASQFSPDARRCRGPRGGLHHLAGLHRVGGPWGVSLNPHTSTLSSRRRPFLPTRRSTSRAISRSIGARTWWPLSEQCHLKPRWIRFSAISRPMKPPPTTTAGVRGQYRLESRVGIHAGGQRRVPFDPLTDRLDVWHGSQPKDSREIYAWQGWSDWRCTGGKHELIVFLGSHLAGDVVLEVHGFLFGRDADYLTTRPGN